MTLDISSNKMMDGFVVTRMNKVLHRFCTRPSDWCLTCRQLIRNMLCKFWRVVLLANQYRINLSITLETARFRTVKFFALETLFFTLTLENVLLVN